MRSFVEQDTCSVSQDGKELSLSNLSSLFALPLCAASFPYRL